MFLPFVVPPERPDFTKEGRVPTATTRPAGDHGPIMCTPLDPRHTPVGLTVASPSEPAPEEHSRFPAVPWLLAAVAWTAAVALVGSQGFIEAAVVEGRADVRLAAAVGTPASVR